MHCNSIWSQFSPSCKVILIRCKVYGYSDWLTLMLLSLIKRFQFGSGAQCASHWRKASHQGFRISVKICWSHLTVRPHHRSMLSEKERKNERRRVQIKWLKEWNELVGHFFPSVVTNETPLSWTVFLGFSNMSTETRKLPRWPVFHRDQLCNAEWLLF